jgi:signal transduction histidine kinase/ActR/RegA family two-component response regulator/HAMP domain-containing protein
MSTFLRDTPIKRKLMLVILLASALALFLMGSALITYEVITFRRSLAVNMGVLAEIIGSNSTAALAFRDAKSGNEILNALSAEHQITSAAIYDDQGNIFVHFPTDVPESKFSPRPERDGYHFSESHLEMCRPIVLDKSRIGTIYLQADLTAMYARVGIYGILLVVVTACAALGAIALTTTLQQRISQPILELANVATAVSERQDYSVRATRHGSDEIGQLTDAFNQMLTRIGESSTALMASEERLRLALEGSQTGTWDWNLLTNHVTWDDYMYPLFARTKEDFDSTYESFVKFVHPEDREKLETALQAAIDSKTNVDVDFRIVDRDDSIRYMASRGRAFYDGHGRPVRMSGVNMDVTAMKRNAEDLSRAKEEAEAANQAKDNFLAILSHELRTPLTPVLSTVAMLEEDTMISATIPRELEMIRRNIEVEARLIDDLLDVTGIMRGKLELHRQVVDIQPLLEHAMQNYCGQAAEKKRLRVSTQVTASQTHVMADASRMTQVFWNLLQNACKFTPDGGAITIRVYNDAAITIPEGEDEAATSLTDLVVEIKDTGIGISAEDMSRVFNAFEQGERSRTRTFGGLGLGLAISRAIVEMHGGSITAASDGTNKGATMAIRLHTVPAPLAKLGSSREIPVVKRGTPARKLRVLLVEDHRDTAEQLTRLLKRAGHEVTLATTIREARELISTQSADPERTFNILISDLGLPDGSGQDLMRDLAARHPIPGIALSGYGMKDDIQNSMAAGFSRHITKPVDWQELKRAIQKIAVTEEAAGRDS